MKKSLLLSVCLAFASLSSFGASLSSIMLQHNGSVTMFDSDKMTAAIAAAVKGDTIYLSEGSFSGAFTINKEISIIGAGQDTKIQGDITIAIDNTPTLTAHLLDALSISGNTVNVTKALKNLKIRKCYINKLSFSAAVTDLNIDRCNLASLYPGTYVKSGNILNSYISYFRGESGQPNTINMINCNINSVYNYNYYAAATFINSIINTYENNSTFTNCVFINSYYPSNFVIASSSSVQNCYNINGVSWTQYTEDKTKVSYYTISVDWLKENNCLGTDGTIIGMFGGTSPYNLVPNVPTVTESKVTVDMATKKLNVSLKVSAN